MIPDVFLDLETRTAKSVRDVGVDAMVEGGGIILSAHYAIGDGPVANWRGAFAPEPSRPGPDPAPLLDAIAAGARVWAHNARFDRTVWNGFKPAHWPAIGVDQAMDSATLCRVINWPAALGMAVDRIGGHKLDNKRYHVLWSEKGVPLSEAMRPLYEEMLHYGDGDVVGMRQLIRTLPPLSSEMVDEWQAAERVNDRGFAIDVGWAKLASDLFAQCSREGGDEVRRLTRGLVGTAKSAQALLAWLEMHTGRPLQRAVKVRIGGGRAGFRTEVKATADKAARGQLQAWLLEADDAPTVAAPLVLDVLDAVANASDTAGTKYKAAVLRVSADGRLRGSYIMHGASQTGRFSAGGLQPHNLIRHKSKDPAAERAAVEAAPSTKGVGKLLRSTIIAPKGHVLVWRDWSAIEARITPWLAIGPDTPEDERRTAQAVLDVFSGGGDAYLHAASGIYGRPIAKDDPERQVGKVVVLSLGFAGGTGALLNMARSMAIEVPNPEKVVAAYRETNPWVMWLCRTVEKAAHSAVCHPGVVYPAGRMALVANAATLALILPDGSALHYPNPRIELVDRFGGGDEDWTVTFDHPKFGRAAFSGPVCSENPTQAVATRILRRCLVAHERAHVADPRVGPIVMHTHDEMVAECDYEHLQLTAEALDTTMSTFEAWADGLPMASEGGYGRFYQTQEKSA